MNVDRPYPSSRPHQDLRSRMQAMSYEGTDYRQGTAQPPWDDASITMMAEVHLLHDQPTCPFDDTPITFTSMPNPRRKARYRLSCFYCGRHAEMNWPPPEAKR